MARPRSNSQFAWLTATCGEVLVCTPLADVAPHAFTTRQLQLRGSAEQTAVSWEAVGHTFGVAPAAIVRMQQVHGASVVVVRAGEPREQTPWADALVTNDPAVALSVAVADCVPILMADARRGVVSAVHAGWRGTCASIAVRAVEALREHFGCDPRDLVAAIGPSIGPCCYEVGAEVKKTFENNGFDREHVERWFRAAPGDGIRERLRLDLWSANRDQLACAGVSGDRIHLSLLCSFTGGDRFCSYRRDGDSAGRMVAVIRMKDSA